MLPDPGVPGVASMQSPARIARDPAAARRVRMFFRESGGILLRPATGPQRRPDLGHLSNLTSSLFVEVGESGQSFAFREFTFLLLLRRKIASIWTITETVFSGFLYVKTITETALPTT